VRGGNGYVVCPGSLHPETKELYKIVNNSDLADPPQWLLDYILAEETTQGAATDIAETTTREKITFIEDSFIDYLPISKEQKLDILNGEEKGSRSEKSMEVMIALVANGVPDADIKLIFDTYRIGEKYREQSDKDKYFNRELNNAKEYVATNHDPTLQRKQAAAENWKSITVHSLLDVIQSNRQFDFMIDNVWPKGEALLITGVGGVGKSLMTLQLVMDLVNPPAKGFLDTHKITNPNEKHRVLFIQSENSFTGMKKRLTAIRDSRSGYTISDAVLRESLFFAGMGNDITTTGNFEDKAYTDELARKVEEVKADIIVVDPLISFHGRDENSNDEMRRVLDTLSDFCRRMSVTPLLVHHHGKHGGESGQGGGRGASAIGDWSPNTWELTKSKEGYTLSPKKTRNFEPPADIRLKLNYCRFRPLSAAGSGDKLAIAIQALKGNNGKFDKQEDFTTAIQEILKAESQDAPSPSKIVDKYIKLAVKEGLVSENQKGKSKKYELNEEAVKKYSKK